MPLRSLLLAAALAAPPSAPASRLVEAVVAGTLYVGAFSTRELRHAGLPTRLHVVLATAPWPAHAPLELLGGFGLRRGGRVACVLSGVHDPRAAGCTTVSGCGEPLDGVECGAP